MFDSAAAAIASALARVFGQRVAVVVSRPECPDALGAFVCSHWTGTAAVVGTALALGGFRVVRWWAARGDVALSSSAITEAPATPAVAADAPTPSDGGPNTAEPADPNYQPRSEDETGRIESSG